ncbi:GNAT family N-acetyltransferase [Brevibacillus centrosporus]|uniref:GNAT family N-acetyltransferase n=1 Tax=Brevibacillus centrosporus TaxID=54910 RepID=UPI0039858CE2
MIIRGFRETDDYPFISQYQLPQEQAIYTSTPIEVIKTFRADPNQKPYVIYTGDQLIGCFVLNGHRSANIYTDERGSLVFKSFSIDARFQKRGYAYEALRALPEIAKQEYPGKTQILLTVHHTNTPAISLYQKAGFEDKGYRYAGTHGEELIFHLLVKEEEKIKSR